jgi:translation initiation factor IF-3
VRRFLAEGHRVKVTIMFRGREMAHTHLGKNLLDRLIQDLAPYATPENPPRLEGRNMYAFLVAKPGVVIPVGPEPETKPEETHA